jgi:hypothetical protein
VVRAGGHLRPVAQRVDDPLDLSGDGLDEELTQDEDGLEGEVDESHRADGPREDEQRVPTGVQQVARVEARGDGHEAQHALDGAPHPEGKLREQREPEDAERAPAQRRHGAGQLLPALFEEPAGQEQPDHRPGQEVGEPRGNQFGHRMWFSEADQRVNDSLKPRYIGVSGVGVYRWLPGNRNGRR